MGTRSTTRIIERRDGYDRTLLVFYRQYDGYPEEHGRQIVEFLNGIKMCNGIPLGKTQEKQLANGAGCLAAQMLVHFKTAVENRIYKPEYAGMGISEIDKGNHVGGIYVYPEEQHGLEQYTYEVIIADNEISSVSWECCDGRKGEWIFRDGLPTRP